MLSFKHLLGSVFITPLASQNRMETLEFIIYPDGRVQEKVTGIVGSSCAEVTAEIEAQLGHVISYQPTSDYFVNANHETSNVQSSQMNFNQWS